LTFFWYSWICSMYFSRSASNFACCSLTSCFLFSSWSLNISISCFFSCVDGMKSSSTWIWRQKRCFA
jgi:hypothetical protein